MIPPISLRRRLLLGFLPVLITATGTMVFLANHFAENMFYHSIDRILRAHTRGLYLILEHSSDPNERQLLFSEVLADISTTRPALFRIEPSLPNSPVLTNVDPNASAPWEYQPPPALGYPHSITYQEQEYRQIISQEFGETQSYKIFLSASIETLHDDLRHLIHILLLVTGLAIILAVVLSIGSVYWALIPVNQAGRYLQGLPWDSPHPDPPLQALKFPVELAPFQQALDLMISRVNRFVDRHRQFSRNAAHELRTPITLAKTTLQGALYESHNEEQYRKIIGEALIGLDRMSDLIEQLQLLCFLEDAPGRNYFETVDLVTLLEQCIATHCPNSQLQVQCPSPLLVQGNPTLMQCLWNNLLDNARQYAPDEHPIAISLTLEDSYACVQIQNQGHIAPEELPYLTDRFYRVEKSRNRKHGGGGLGLTIVQEIVKHHEGKLSITSTPTQGTCVKVCLTHTPTQSDT